ncbi:hypothetical protein ACH4U6_34115 [Streptomyces netropsis]|uniref:hypothetical protein n=1 Tax=Streptomyces netropsis TaxID=55404 RepID=UPI0037B69A3E
MRLRSVEDRLVAVLAGSQGSGVLRWTCPPLREAQALRLEAVCPVLDGNREILGAEHFGDRLRIVT